MTGEEDIPLDPFSAEDPEALAREQRRREREAKRRERSGRSSLSKRVGGMIDGVAERGRDALEEAKQQAAPSPGAASEPPPMRRPPPTRAGPLSAGASEAQAREAEADEASARGPGSDSPAVEPTTGRMSAEELMPRRERQPTLSSPGITDDFEVPPPPVERRSEAPLTGEWGIGGEGAPPRPLPPIARGSGSPPPDRPGAAPVWLRWLVALVLIVLIVVAVVVGVPKLVDRISGEEETAPVAREQKPVRTTTLTIPEGYTRAQIAKLAADAGLRGNYMKETDRAPKAFKAKKKGAPGDASLEGFLFPSTYELERRGSVNELIDQQLTAFNTNIAQVNLKKAEKANLTQYDIVIIASMIEREVMVPDERPIVAAVIYNRLREGMPLGIDATLRYHLDNFHKPLTESDLATDSPYNTRTSTGLPPTPIANPGLASLEAAANPTNDKYLYYVVKPNTCGEHFFTDDYDEFLQASEEYNSAREAEGKAPTDC